MLHGLHRLLPHWPLPPSLLPFLFSLCPVAMGKRESLLGRQLDTKEKKAQEEQKGKKTVVIAALRCMQQMVDVFPSTYVPPSLPLSFSAPLPPTSLPPSLPPSLPSRATADALEHAVTSLMKEAEGKDGKQDPAVVVARGFHTILAKRLKARPFLSPFLPPSLFPFLPILLSHRGESQTNIPLPLLPSLSPSLPQSLKEPRRPDEVKKARASLQALGGGSLTALSSSTPSSSSSSLPPSGGSHHRAASPGGGGGGGGVGRGGVLSAGAKPYKSPMVVREGEREGRRGCVYIATSEH